MIILLYYSSLCFRVLGIERPRESVDGTSLPSARKVSLEIHPDLPTMASNSPVFTLMHMTFGQFLVHDIDLTPISKLRLSGKYIQAFCRTYFIAV